MSISSLINHLKYSIQVSTAATISPMSMDYLRDALRIDTYDEDQKLERLLQAATIYLQKTLGRQFINATLIQHTDRVPVSSSDHLDLRINPVSSISSISYKDSDGDTTTWASSKYQTDLESEPARVKPSITNVWPAVQQNRMNAFSITFIAGYGASESNLPEDIKHTIAMLVSHWYYNPDIIGRGKELPFALSAMIDNLRWDIP